MRIEDYDDDDIAEQIAQAVKMWQEAIQLFAETMQPVARLFADNLYPFFSAGLPFHLRTVRPWHSARGKKARRRGKKARQRVEVGG